LIFMDILPAIDLRGGKCVRLLQGDYARQIDYSDDPLAQARLFHSQHAQWLHIVDLDGALHGRMQNAAIIEKIVNETPLKVEVGGGIRQEETISELLQIGVTQVVIGTRALEDPEWFKNLLKNDRYAHRLVLGLDAQNDRIATHGWTHIAAMTALEMAQIVSSWPLAAIVYTDIARDGMLTGPNIPATDSLARNCRVPIIASGGIGDLSHVKQLTQLPIKGMIIGRALYEGRFTLAQALEIVNSIPNI